MAGVYSEIFPHLERKRYSYSSSLPYTRAGGAATPAAPVVPVPLVLSYKVQNFPGEHAPGPPSWFAFFYPQTRCSISLPETLSCVPHFHNASYIPDLKNNFIIMQSSSFNKVSELSCILVMDVGTGGTGGTCPHFSKIQAKCLFHGT